MKSVSMHQQARYGALTLATRMGHYEVLSLRPEVGTTDCMFVVLPINPDKPKKLAKELRAIAKRLEKSE